MTFSFETLYEEERKKPYFKAIAQALKTAQAEGKTVYPPKTERFAALKLTPYEKVKVVILGQDPYHDINQAHGLSFSVRKNIKIPPSLRNIYLELHNDLGILPAKHGDLTALAEQGVLLLNTVLTVEAHQPQSHAKIGWQIFTDRVIEVLNQREKPMVFLLWGAAAQNKAVLINHQKHLVLKSTHPSPLSAHRGFLGCKHFSKCNAWLIQQGQTPIDWQIR